MATGSRYRDRTEAGERLAEEVARAWPQPHRPLVLALPRGGVPVALPVAMRIGAGLDVLLVRKIGAPRNPELAMGAVAVLGRVVAVVREPRGLAQEPAETFERARAAQQAELTRRADRYRPWARAVDVEDADVVVVDDGIATGSTVRAALQALRSARPRGVMVAVPVAPPEAVRSLLVERLADVVVCPRRPEAFRAVGDAYADFAEVPEPLVMAMLATARPPSPPPPP